MKKIIVLISLLAFSYLLIYWLINSPEKSSVLGLATHSQGFIFVELAKIQLMREKGLSGKGIKIALIDSIVNTNEVEVTGSVSFLQDKEGIEDGITHATISALLLKNELVPDVELYSVEALNHQGVGTYEAIIKGVQWSIQNEMDIISFSFTGHEYLKELHDIIKAADQKGIIMIAAAGNYADEKAVYPSAFHEVISVGALDYEGEIAHYSNFGHYVDVYALGEVEKYNTAGTSFAVQYVTGLFALMKEDGRLYIEKIKSSLQENQDIFR